MSCIFPIYINLVNTVSRSSLPDNNFAMEQLAIQFIRDTQWAKSPKEQSVGVYF